MLTLLRITRYLGAFSATYIIFVISINIGYISIIGDWAAELFSISDTLQVNMLLLRSLIFFVGAFAAFAFLVVMPLVLIFERKINSITWQPDFEATVTRFFDRVRTPNWRSYILMAMALILVVVASRQSEGRGIFIDILPMLVVTVLQFWYIFYVRRIGAVSELFFLWGLLINLVFLGHSLGKAWARDDQSSIDRIVSVYDAQGTCVVRRVARALGGNGILFYNEYSKGYEFRRFETVRSMVPKNTCA